ncbi:hypothetical protein GCM10027405_30060 [Arthrobacter alkaliphilus]|uniref:flagellar hook-length control protein FliK n=1 Tax=Arthrobacter alkaliphilus TaxID=369936 RepID=UPI001F3E99A7|nr:flagellar hook-length control protein FliK [Arthrobacter alkaliphilus]
MQLPPARAASPRPAVTGPSSVQQPGALGAAGFEAVMSGMLASGSKALHESAHQAPDGGTQDKPAGDRPGTVARAAKPEASKVAKAVVDVAGCIDPAAAVGVAPAAGLISGMAGVAAPAAAASGIAAVVAPAAGGLAAAAVPGTAALQATGAVVGAPAKDGVVPGTAPAKTVTDTTPAAPGLVVGTHADSTQVAPAGTAVGAAPSNAVRSAASNVPAAPSAHSAGQSPVQPSPVAADPLRPGSPPTQPLPAVLEPDTTKSGTTKPGTTATAAQPGEPGTAVVPLVGESATQQAPQQDSPKVLGQDKEAAAAPGLPAAIQAGAPAVVPSAPTLQAVPSPAAPGTATPAVHAEPPKLLPQVSGPLFSLASAAPGSHVMTLKLSPEDLGPLTVRAHIEGAAVRIELFAPGEAGREAVRSILPELRRGLGESGFGASLDLSEHNAPPDAWAGASDQRGSDARDRRPAESPAFPQGGDGEAVRLPRTAVVLPRSITSSLDILV